MFHRAQDSTAGNSGKIRSIAAAAPALRSARLSQPRVHSASHPASLVPLRRNSGLGTALSISRSRYRPINRRQSSRLRSAANGGSQGRRAATFSGNSCRAGIQTSVRHPTKRQPLEIIAVNHNHQTAAFWGFTLHKLVSNATSADRSAEAISSPALAAANLDGRSGGTVGWRSCGDAVCSVFFCHRPSTGRVLARIVPVDRNFAGLREQPCSPSDTKRYGSVA